MELISLHEQANEDAALSSVWLTTNTRPPHALVGRNTTLGNLSSSSFSFSACLLVKDENMVLSEWLAYHYAFLPLRRLIVALDPLSITDPQPIFDLFQSLGMDITVWINDTNAFWKDGKEDYKKKDYVITNGTGFKK